MKHSNLCNDALMNLNWKIHEGAHALLRYGRGCGDSDGFTVTRGAEFHVERKTSRSDRVTLSYRPRSSSKYVLWPTWQLPRDSCSNVSALEPCKWQTLRCFSATLASELSPRPKSPLILSIPKNIPSERPQHPVPPLFSAVATLTTFFIVQATASLPAIQLASAPQSTSGTLPTCPNRYIPQTRHSACTASGYSVSATIAVCDVAHRWWRGRVSGWRRRQDEHTRTTNENSAPQVSSNSFSTSVVACYWSNGSKRSKTNDHGRRRSFYLN